MHHAEPTLAWHRRPARYRAVRTDLLRASRYHLIASYAQLARNYLFEAKEPLLHPSLVRARSADLRAEPPAGLPIGLAARTDTASNCRT